MKKALVVIDVQKGFINKETEMLPNKIVEYTKRNNFDYILGTAYINSEETACYKFEGWKSCMEGTEEAELVPEIKEIVQKVFKKGKYSCWNDEFKEFIKSNGIDELYFAGISTACCVLHSVFDAYNDLQSCYVVKDLCGSTRGESTQKAAVQILRECITEQRVISSK